MSTFHGMKPSSQKGALVNPTPCPTPCIFLVSLLVWAMHSRFETGVWVKIGWLVPNMMNIWVLRGAYCGVNIQKNCGLTVKWFPYALYMVYVPTLVDFEGQMLVNTPYMEHMGCTFMVGKLVFFPHRALHRGFWFQNHIAMPWQLWQILLLKLGRPTTNRGTTRPRNHNGISMAGDMYVYNIYIYI